MKHFVIRSLFFLTLLLASTHSVLALDFNTFYEVNYKFSDDGIATVEQQISLVNQIDNLYATQYSLSFADSIPQNIKAYDGLGEIKTSTPQKDNSHIVTAFLNEKTIGKDKIAVIILKYTLNTAAVKNGNQWEITLPGYSPAPEIESYDITLTVPVNFGRLSQVYPVPKSIQTNNSSVNYRFSQKELNNRGVFAVFGHFQTYRLNLRYPLNNPYDYPVSTTITLPPDTNRQLVYYHSIEPQPDNVTVDPDGNWLAHYQLPALSEQEVLADLSVKVVDHNPAYPVTTTDLSSYTTATTFWPRLNIANPPDTPKKIFDFVVKQLEYDSTRIGLNPVRQGAEYAINNPATSLCTEYTDTFIALSRMAGIPAREIEGLGITDNPKLNITNQSHDVLHSWPEYYNSADQQWHAVDPTWQDTSDIDYFTKFDHKHITFVIHGLDDTQPYPAGSYQNDDDGKLISFTVLETDLDFPSPQWSLVSSNDQPLYTYLKRPHNITIINNGGQAIYQPKFSITSPFTIVSDPPLVIPPYSKHNLLLVGQPVDRFSDYQLTASLVVDDTILEVLMPVKSFLLRIFIPIFLILTIIVGMLIYQHRKSTLNNAQNT